MVILLIMMMMTIIMTITTTATTTMMMKMMVIMMMKTTTITRMMMLLWLPLLLHSLPLLLLDVRRLHDQVSSGEKCIRLLQLVKASASKAEDPRFDFRLRRGGFSGSSHTGDFKKWHSSGYPALGSALVWWAR